MKKIILAAVVICAAYVSDAQTVFTMDKSGGGAFGYRLVSQTTDQTGTSIICTGSGYDKCVYTPPPTLPESAEVERTFDHVDSELSNGVYSGEITIGGVYATWSGEDAYNCKIAVVSN